MKKLFLLIFSITIFYQSNSQTFIQLNDEFISLFNKKQYKEALPIGIKAITKAKQEYGETSENYAIALHNVAECYFYIADWRKAITHYLLAIKIYKKAKTVEDCSDIALCNSSLGTSYLELKKYDSTGYYFEKSYAFFVNNPTTDYDNAIAVMNKLTSFYFSDNKFESCKKVYDKILPVVEKKEGLLSENYVTIFSNYIYAITSLQEYGEVEKKLKPYLIKLNTQKVIYKKEIGFLYYHLAIALENLSKYKEALTYFTEAEKIYKEVNGSVINEDLALYNNYIGLCYLYQNSFDSAAYHFEISFNYFIKDANGYQNLITIASNLYLSYTNNERDDKWKIALEKLLPVIEKTETTKSENYCLFLADYCLTLRKLSNYNELEKLSKKLILIRKQLNGRNTIEYANSLDVLGICLSTINKLNEANDSLQQALKIKQNVAPKDTNSFVITYNTLGDVFSKKGEFNKAYDCFNRSVFLLEKSNQQNTENYLVTLRSFAYTYVEGGLYAEAKKMLNKVLQINVDTKGKDFAGNGEILVTIANAEYQLNELISAKQHALEAKEIVIKHFGENDILITCHNVIGLVEHKLGNTEMAVDALTTSLNLSKKIFGEQSLRTASIYSNFGIIYQEINQYANAEIALKKSLEIIKGIVGTSHPEYALSEMNLAMVYAMQGGEDKAVDMLKDAMDIYIKADLAGTNNFMKLLNNLTLIVNQLGAYDEAKKLYLQQLQILDKKEDFTSLIRYMLLNNLSTCCINGKYYAEARDYALQAIELVKKSQGVKNIEYIKSSNNLMIAYKYLHEREKAKNIAKELLPIVVEVTGDESELSATVYFNLFVFSKEEDKQNAKTYILKCIKNKLKIFNDNFYTLSEADKLNWWNKNDFFFKCFVEFAVKNKLDQSLMNELINVQLKLKGFVLNDASATLKKARSISDKGVSVAIDKWQQSRTLLARQMSLPINQRFYKVDSLENIANNLEKEINVKTSGLLKINTATAIAWQSIQNKLSDNEAAIEFLQFSTINNENAFTDSFNYAAIIIKKDKLPQLVNLCTEQQVLWCLTGGNIDDKEVRINRLYRSTIKKNNSTESFAGDSLYKLLFQPLIPYLKDVQTVSYAPVGLLNKIAFHAMPISKDSLMLDKYQLQQYSSIRSIAERTLINEKMNSAFLMGNADFDAALNKTETATIVTDKTWVALPGTEKEINGIVPLFTNKNYSVNYFLAQNATEEKFKFQSNHSANIIHIATHGFFLKEEKKTNLKETVSSATESNFSFSQNPLMRSGIVLASANRTWNAKKIMTEKEDGIVTAYEISQLNLNNTKLVVLSACETALGDVQGNEGVFGLQRAFKIAGVKNMIVSLWQVPDNETAELMKIFYSNLLTSNNVREAFYFAQKEMRKKYAPYQWAAFVLVE